MKLPEHKPPGEQNGHSAAHRDELPAGFLCQACLLAMLQVWASGYAAAPFYVRQAVCSLLTNCNGTASALLHGSEHRANATCPSIMGTRHGPAFGWSLASVGFPGLC